MASEPTHCPLCAATETVELSSRDRHGDPLVSRCCQSCGLVFNDPVPDEGALREFYSVQYRRQYKKTVQPKLKHHIRYARRIVDQLGGIREHIFKSTRVLDIGSGSGEFLALMKAWGKQVQGIEPTVDYAAYVESTFGVPVFCGSLDDFRADQPYDFIRMSHVLEHTRDPVEKLAVVRGLLADDGLFLLEVPDFVTYCRTKSSGNIFHFGHIYNFDAATLRMVVAKAGFAICQELAPTGLLLEKGTPATLPADPENAKRNLAAFEGHKTGENTAGARGLAKLGGKIRRIAREKQLTLKLATPAKVIDFYARDLSEPARRA